MKILFYSPVGLRNGGGAERWHLGVAARLAARPGVKVRLVTCAYGDDNLSLAAIAAALESVQHEVLPCRVIGGLVIPTSAARRRLKEAFVWADVVHSLFGFIGHDLMVRRLANLTGTPVVNGVHAPLITTGVIHNLYVRTVGRWLTLPSCARHLVFNDEQRQILTDWGLTAVDRVSGGVDERRFGLTPLPAGRRLQVLYLGRWAPEKGVDILAAAWRKWLSSRTRPPAAQLILVGAGEMRPTLAALAQDFPNQVTLYGYAADPRPWLRAAHLLVMPSRQETFGIAMVEAMSIGRPVLASRAEGPRQLIKSGKTGWLFSPLTPAQLATVLERVYNQWRRRPAVFKTMGLAAHRSVARFSFAAVADSVWASSVAAAACRRLPNQSKITP